MKPRQIAVVGLFLTCAPVLLALAWLANTYQVVPTEHGPADAKLWRPRPRPETLLQRRARLAKLREELRRMATTWGEAVRTGTAEGFSWSGTITAYLAPNGEEPGPSTAPTGFSSLSVGCYGSSASLALSGVYSYVGQLAFYQNGVRILETDPIFPLLWASVPHPLPSADGETVLVYVFTATVTAGTNTSSKNYACAYEWDASGKFWLTELAEITSGYSLGTGGIIKRQHGIALPEMLEGGAARQMMHPTDCHVRDAWYVTPGSVYTVSAFGLSASYTRRDAYPGQTDAQIGDAIMGYGVPNIGVAMGRLGPTNAEGPFATVTGPGFTGMDNSFTNGSGGEVANIRARGTGGSVSGWDITGAGNMTAASWSGEESPGLEYSFDAQACLWDETDTVDPVVNAGMVDEDGEPIMAALSALPTSPNPGAWVGSGVAYGLTVPYRIHPAQTMSVEIDPFWAMDNWCDPGETQVFADKELPVNDRYLCTRPPAVNAATWTEVGSIGRRDANVVPLVARKALPDTRWVVSGGGSTVDSPEEWRIPAGSVCNASCALQTRYWDRLALIPQAGKAILWEWPLKLYACADGEHVDTADEPTYAEDVFSWKDHGWLKIEFEKPALMALEFVLRLGYSTVEVTDPHYTCGEHRIEEWEYTRSDATASYTVRIGANETDAVVDLLCPDGGETPCLQIVNTVEFVGLRNSTTGDQVVKLVTLQPCGDQGWDHTGRGTREEPLTVADTTKIKSVECWDFTSDYEGVHFRRDGSPYLTQLPDEPNRGGTPERGFGTIGKAEHCPFSGTPGEINFARALASLGYLGWSQGITATIDTGAIDAMTESTWKGTNDPEVLCSSWQFWTAVNTFSPGLSGLSLLAALHTRDYLLALGNPTTVVLRKVLGGSALTLLKTNDGRRRATTDTEGAANWRYVLHWRPTAYYTLDPTTGDRTDLPDTPGNPLPPVNEWRLWRYGAVADRLDAHGVFEWPGMSPTTTRVNNPTQSQTDASAQTTWATVEYVMQWWASDAWQSFDINTQHDEMLAHEDCFGERTAGTVKSRRYALVPMLVNTVPGGRISLRLSHMGLLTMTRPGTATFAGETPPAGELLYDMPTRHGGGFHTQRTTVLPRLGMASLDSAKSGHSWIAGHTWPSGGQVTLLRTLITGEEPETVATIDGYSYPTVRCDFIGRPWMLARRDSDGMAVALRLLRGTGGAPDTIEEVGTLAVTRAQPAGLDFTPDGDAVAVLPVDAGLSTWRGRSCGTAWEEA